MESLCLVENDGPRDWAALLRFGALLAEAGVEVSRVLDGPPGTAGGLHISGGLASVRRLLCDPELGTGITAFDAGPGQFSLLALRRPVVAAYGSAGAPYHHMAVLAAAGCDVFPIGAQAIRDGALKYVDVFVMPGGGWEFMEGQLSRLGVEGARAIRSFVEAGGCYLSSCAGTHCVLQLPEHVAADWHPARAELPHLAATSRLQGTRETNNVKSPGIGVIAAHPVPGHPITLGMPASVDCVYYNGPILEPTSDRFVSLLACGAPDPLRFTAGESLFGASVQLSETGIAQSTGCSAAGVQAHGLGQVVGFGLHPEFGSDPSMLNWGRAALMVANAAYWAAAISPRHPEPRRFAPRAKTPDVAAHFEQALAALGRIAEKFDALRSTDAAILVQWLDPKTARSAFGRGPESIWSETLTAGRALAESLTERLACEESRLSHSTRAMDLLFTSAVDATAQDFGFVGLLMGLDAIETMLDTLSVQGKLDPYRAVAMSYLSAFGRLTATSLLIDTAIETAVQERVSNSARQQGEPSA